MDDKVVWGEGDVRDCMAEFDPTADAWGPYGVVGRRGAVCVYAFWSGVRYKTYISYQYAFVCQEGVDDREFLDPIEAIRYALSLLHKFDQES